MIRSFLPLAAAMLALPAVSLPATAQAAPPAAIVVVPVAVVAMPAAPVALFREMDAMQVQMAALMRLAARPPALPAMAGLAAPPVGGMRITMVRASGGEGVCSEQMEIMPGHDGRMHIFVRRSAGCAPQAAAMPAHPPQTLRGYPPQALGGYPPQARPRLPADALPPPSKTIEAEDLVPGRARAAG
ncbi:MAG: hypothetical protein B7Z59_02885 [Acidiphilium sp. 37-67-22]|nr:MAG: hypothetical protein B7Z59_02885 [Acidiphilium sp. 37-67-22]